MPKYTSLNKDISDEFNRLYLDAVLGAKAINYSGTVTGDDEEDEGPAAKPIVYYDEKLFAGPVDGNYTYDCEQLARLVEETRNGICNVFSGDPDNTIGTLEVTDKEIIIKDVTVTYRDPGGRKSSVTSDISIGIPQLGYLMTQYSISGIPDFSLICKGTLHQDDVTGKDAKIYGSAYANDVKLENDNSLTLGNGGTFIIKEDININGGAVGKDRFTANANTTLWAKNIVVNNSTTASLVGSTYINNDLKFNGTKSKVTLLGTYYGFGCDDINPENSSSIIFNHPTESDNKNNLSLYDETTGESLSNLILAGVSYVSNKDRFIPIRP
ncbi:MAG: hypothetical protein IKN56_07565, partial [Clostridia bacterium]|nr:hypothetical protein [Clostridia bacterium]